MNTDFKEKQRKNGQKTKEDKILFVTNTINNSEIENKDIQTLNKKPYNQKGNLEYKKSGLKSERKLDVIETISKMAIS